MDEYQQRLHEDLSGLLNGEVAFDPLVVAMYASDASLYEISPLGVVYPKDHDDVVQLAKYASEVNLPLIPRGAGSGVAGGAIGEGLIVDCSRHLRAIEAIHQTTVRVQAGVTLQQLNTVLREYGRYFSPDPANASVTTVGGMLGVDAAGSHAVRVGSMRDHVLSLLMVLGNGESIEVGEEAVGYESTVPNDMEEAIQLAQEDWTSHKQILISKLAKLLRDNTALINEKQPPLPRNCSGYLLQGVLVQDRLQLNRMLVGSEGTLGLFTAATLHTSPLPAHRGVVLMLFGGLEPALHAVQTIAEYQPSACDLLDRRLLSLAREADRRFERIIPLTAETALIVEMTGLSDKQVRRQIRSVVAAVEAQFDATSQRYGGGSGMVVAAEAYAFEDVEFLWTLPTRVVPHLIRLRGSSRALPFVEDIAVAPENLHDVLKQAQRVLQKYEVTASLYAHAASGQIHLRPFLPLPKPEDGSRIEAIARELYQMVIAAGGTISGEHGDGLSRTAFLRTQYGDLYRVFRQVKDLFDPHNIMNPGKIISDNPHLTSQNLRRFEKPQKATGLDPELVELQLQWTPDQLADTASRCNGCGVCRTTDTALRMCPFFREDAVEEASPRSKANVVRALMSGRIDQDEFTSESMRRLASLCFNCKQCELECPSNVNIPQMMIEARAAYVASNGMSRANWILSRAHSFGAFGSMMSLATNWALQSPVMRWGLQNLFGISRHRKLPRFARRSFLRTIRRDLYDRPALDANPRPIVYFVDHYANYHDPELARAFVSIAHHNGIPVHVPRDQTGSGMAMISAGDLTAAKEVAEENVSLLVELARERFPIVCTEPAAALCLKYEYPNLIDHPDVKMVADQVVEAGQWLHGLHQEQKLRTDFQPLKLDVGYHTPCHLKALGTTQPLKELLALIPELHLHTIEKGCSGMAGAFGLTREHFRTSIRIGWPLINRMRLPDLDAGATECSSCKIQMEQGTPTPTLHPLKLLALAYGIMPELQRKLKPSREKLVVT